MIVRSGLSVPSRPWGVAVSARHLWFISFQLLHIGFLVFSACGAGGGTQGLAHALNKASITELCSSP